MSTKLTYTGAEVQELLDKIEKGDFDNAKTLEGYPASYFAIASEFADFKSLFDSMFEKDSDGNIHAKLSLWSSGGITAGGVGSGGSGGGGGESYNRLDSWADYSADKSGWVLSALLGKDLDNRVSALANAGYVTQSALAPYALRSEIPSLDGYATQSWVVDNYLSKNGGTVNGSVTLSIGNIVVSSGDTVVGKLYPRTDNEYTLGQDTRKWKNILCYNINGSTPVNASNLKSTLGISDWALASVKPTYTASEVGAVSVYGGTINSPSLASLVINRNNSTGASVITFTRNSDFTHFLGFNDNSGPKWLNADYQEYPLLHSGNYSSYALSVNGGTVNGSVYMNGYFRLGNSQPIMVADTDRVYQSALYLSAGNNLLIGYGTSVVGKRRTLLFGNTIEFKSNGGEDSTLVLNADRTATFSSTVSAPSFIGNLTGNADSASCLRSYFVTRPTSANQTLTGKGRLFKMLATSSMTDGKPDGDGHIIHSEWDITNGYDAQLFLPNNTFQGHHPQWRAHNGGSWGEWITMIDSGNISSFNAGSATKLATSRTIWGQSFDGTGDITGPLHLGNNISIRCYSTSGSKISTLILDPSNTLLLGYDMSNIGGTVLYGKALAMRYGTSRTMGFLLNEYGNVAIGSTTADEKLHVYGNGKFTGALTANSLTIGGVTLTYDSVNEALCINGNMYALGGITAGGAGISAYTSLESRVARLEQQLNIS